MDDELAILVDGIGVDFKTDSTVDDGTIIVSLVTVVVSSTVVVGGAGVDEDSGGATLLDEGATKEL